MRTAPRALALAAGVALLAGLAACTGTSSSPAASGGTFVQALQGDPGDLNPLKATDPNTWAALSVAYESLVSVSEDGKFSPFLAKSWKATGTEITYTLKPDITCSDGTPFTAETAAANINYNADPANATFYYSSHVTEAVHATGSGDKLTITSTTNNPFLLADTGTILLVCQDVLDHPTSYSAKTDGTGLFALGKVDPQTSYTFDKRKKYDWGPHGVTASTAGLPDKIQLRVITDESTAVNLLLSGELNSATVLGPDRARLESAKLKSAEQRYPIGEIQFNEKSDRPTADPDVRRALMLALDRTQVADVVSDGTATPAISLVNQPPFLCVSKKPDWTLPDQNLKQAASMLDKAGWVAGSDGKRSKDGKPLTIKFIYNGGTDSQAAAAELIQQTWSKIGVDTELSANDSTKWTEQLYQTFDWDTGFIVFLPGSPVVLSTFLGKTVPEGGLNFDFIDNPQYTDYAKQARAAGDAAESCALWNKAEAALVDRTDVYPLTDQFQRTYMKNATFEMPGYIVPTSVRMEG